VAEVNPGPRPWTGDVRVSVPASVLYDLEEFQRVQAAVLGQAGCRGCTSGMNFIWQVYSEFAVNAAGEVRPVLGDQPNPSPWYSAGTQESG
jgi:hypothetical protein